MKKDDMRGGARKGAGRPPIEPKKRDGKEFTLDAWCEDILLHFGTKGFRIQHGERCD